MLVRGFTGGGAAASGGRPRASRKRRWRSSSESWGGGFVRVSGRAGGVLVVARLPRDIILAIAMIAITTK
jgi:hypothetical protein